MTSPSNREGPSRPYVLLVESFDPYVLTFQRNLTQTALHWRTIRVKDGRTAIQHMMEQSFPDVLVISPNLRKVKLQDVVSWLKSMQTPKRVPVVLYGEIEEYDLPALKIEVGADLFLDTDTTPDVFRRSMQLLLYEAEGTGTQETVLK
jgi:DNA-binding NarL/FixJ family response regulator